MNYENMNDGKKRHPEPYYVILNAVKNLFLNDEILRRLAPQNDGPGE